MTPMPGVAIIGAHLLAFMHRPSSTALAVMITTAVVGWALHVWAEYSTRSAIEQPNGDRRPAPLADQSREAPAVIALLTNDFRTPHTAVTATALDLAARGWIRLTQVDGELVVVTRGAGSAGDSLQQYEQQVLNHLSARAFNDTTSAGTLAASHHRLDRRWWRRFGHSVAGQAQSLGLTIRRYTPVELAPPAVATLIGLVAGWFGARGGDQIAIAESWRSRAVWLAVLIALIWLGVSIVERAVGSDQRPTELGRERARAWMGFRQRLRARIPATATVLAPPEQQVALAQGAVMGVCDQVLQQLPAAPEDHRSAWSEAGAHPHLVRVRYPFRPGYGQHPVRVGVVGVVVFFAVRWVQGWLERVGDGDALTSLMDRVPGQVDLVQTVADVLAAACWIPVLWAVWAVVAGAVDTIATRERTGAVVRARRPSEVLPPQLLSVAKPFAERDRFSTYIAVDDGRRRRVTAWLASERSAAPQGAQARVRATPLLGYVRSSEPIGTATRTEA
jgi:hypothetical protein